MTMPPSQVAWPATLPLPRTATRRRCARRTPPPRRRPRRGTATSAGWRSIIPFHGEPPVTGEPGERSRPVGGRRGTHRAGRRTLSPSMVMARVRSWGPPLVAITGACAMGASQDGGRGGARNLSGGRQRMGRGTLYTDYSARRTGVNGAAAPERGVAHLLRASMPRHHSGSRTARRSPHQIRLPSSYRAHHGPRARHALRKKRKTDRIHKICVLVGLRLNRLVRRLPSSRPAGALQLGAVQHPADQDSLQDGPRLGEVWPR